jgi:hypothetical protein
MGDSADALDELTSHHLRVFRRGYLRRLILYRERPRLSSAINGHTGA